MNIDVAAVQQFVTNDFTTRDRSREICRWEKVSSAESVIPCGAVINNSWLQPHLIHDREPVHLEGIQLKASGLGNRERGASVYREERVTILIIDGDEPPPNENIKITTWTARNDNRSTHAEAISDTEGGISRNERKRSRIQVCSSKIHNLGRSIDQ